MFELPTLTRITKEIPETFIAHALSLQNIKRDSRDI